MCAFWACWLTLAQVRVVRCEHTGRYRRLVSVRRARLALVRLACPGSRYCIALKFARRAWSQIEALFTKMVTTDKERVYRARQAYCISGSRSERCSVHPGAARGPVSANFFGRFRSVTRSGVVLAGPNNHTVLVEFASSACGAGQVFSL